MHLSHWFGVESCESIRKSADQVLLDPLLTCLMCSQSDKRAYVPWIVIAVAVMALGVMHVLFNIITLVSTDLEYSP